MGITERKVCDNMRLIDADAIEYTHAVARNLFDGHNWNELVVTKDEIEDMPTIQPEITHEQAVAYLQSTGWMQEHDRQMMLDGVHRLTAQPEPSWECEKCMMEHTDEMEKLEAELAIAKSKQPEPCEDAVSRQTLKDGFTEMCSLICPYNKKRQHVMCGSCLMGTAFDVLETTPSVTPKQRTGHWILDRSGAYCCSECMEPCASYVMMKPRDKFCKMCGSRNEVTT